MIFCGRPVFHDDFHDVMLNPRVIIEVLSDSTEAFDRSEKFIWYQTYNDTLTDYILVSQKKTLVGHFSRQSDGDWLLSASSGLESSLYLSSIDCRLELSEIYYGITFPSEGAEIGQDAETDQPEQE